MKTPGTLLLAAAAGALLAAESCVSVERPAPVEAPESTDERTALVEENLTEWQDSSALAARLMIAEYGSPNRVEPQRLVWNNNGPWLRTVVWNVTPSSPAAADLGSVEQTVDYSLSPAQVDGLASFDGGLAFNPRSQELTVRSDREQLNVLRLNLADDVAHGRLLPEQARDSYIKTIELEASGKSSPDLLRLRLTP